MHERDASSFAPTDSLPDSMLEWEESTRQVDHLLDLVQVGKVIQATFMLALFDI